MSACRVSHVTRRHNKQYDKTPGNVSANASACAASNTRATVSCGSSAAWHSAKAYDAGTPSPAGSGKAQRPQRGELFAPHKQEQTVRTKKRGPKIADQKARTKKRRPKIGHQKATNPVLRSFDATAVVLQLDAQLVRGGAVVPRLGDADMVVSDVTQRLVQCEHEPRPVPRVLGAQFDRVCLYAELLSNIVVNDNDQITAQEVARLDRHCLLHWGVELDVQLGHCNRHAHSGSVWCHTQRFSRSETPFRGETQFLQFSTKRIL